uniref:Bet v I/Major latex protein domain-containing protein n=1 Tax=Arundo donax TaxID=35708 RepID=A0A0A9BRW1_ARUDO
MVDNKNYVKEARVIEGGFLDLGFWKYSVRFEIIGKEDKTSVIRSTIEYEGDDQHASNASLVSTSVLASIAEAITKYIKEQRSPAQASEQTTGEKAPEQTSEKQAPEQTSGERSMN